MTCFSCKREIQTSRGGFVVCPNCQAVNIAPTSDQFTPGHHGNLLRRVAKHNRLASTAIISIAIVCLFGAVAAVGLHFQQNHAASVPTVRPVSRPAVSSKSGPTLGSSGVPVATSIPKTAPNPAVSSKPALKAPTPQQPLSTLDGIVAAINQQLQPYGVTATLTPPNNAYTYSTWSTLSGADVANLQQFSSYLTQEFRKYPTNLVTNSGLKTIGLVKGLQVSGGARAAAPAPSITGMLYDVNAMTAAGSAYAREVVSHEYWHYLDYKMQGSYTYDDPTWDACNPAGFKYGSGGASAYGADSGYVSAFHPQAAFVTAYAIYAIEEDRAEMFGWLIYSPSSVKNLNDAGINCKINRLTAIIHQLSPAMSF